MVKLLLLIEAITSVVLMICILLQHRASGLSATFGGGGATTYIQRRGAEKLLFRLAIWSSFVFLLIPVLLWYIG
ncbi:MAG: preprotein translocase subunit SecG [Candidatus Peribacteraceae bacterium]|nr:preprotein translocase subunit SecG [Candidatus Peribacteraceae bacterium]MDP7454292.1 preprotein translocase subunit SecG [Candidatus Peribacteraceae bacterium]MDP7645668.1 preprotein translocase subunit SecG [Candidatus Peribacteraceae bacterium]